MRRKYKKYKWVAVLLLSVILILVMASVVMADTPQPLLNNSTIQHYYDKNPPNYGEKFIAGILIGSVKWVMRLFSLSDPVLLVFNQIPSQDKSNTMLTGGLYGPSSGNYVLGLFPEPFFHAVSVLYAGFQALLPIPLVIALIIIAILHMLNSGTVQGRGKLKENVQFVIIAMATVRFGVYIWTGIISLNNFLVKLIWAYMLQAGVKPGFFMDMIWGPGKQGFDSATQMLGIPMVILLIMAAMMVLALNYQYTMRFIILGLLIMIFPLACALTIFPGFRHSLPMWLKEFVANVVLQLAHALALGAFFITLYTKGMGPGISFWLMLTFFAGLPAIAALLRELLGLQHGGGSRALAGISAMAGIASIGAMGRMLTRNPASKGADAWGASGGTDAGGGIMAGIAAGSSFSGGGASGGGTRLSGATSTLGKVGQGAFNAGSAVAGHGITKGAAKLGLGATAALAGGALTSIISGSAAPGAMMGIGAGSVMGRHGGKLLGAAGGHAQTIAQTVSSGGGIRDIGQNMMAHSMEKGGMLAGAGWGLQSAVNKVSSVTGQGEKYAAPSFFKENKQMLNTAQNGMREMKPQMDLAQAKYNQTLSHLGPDNQKTKDLHENYQSLKGIYETHQSDAHLAQTQMRSHEALKQYKATYSPNRGHA